LIDLTIGRMLQSRKEIIEKERKVLFARDIVVKNPVFAREHI
jgi:hypothetical protein